MIFKKITPQDAEKYKALRLLSLQESPFAFSDSYDDENNKTLAQFKEELQIIDTPPIFFILGAFSKNEELIGFLKFKKDTRTKARHKAMIHACYITPEYRNKKCGKKLMQALEQEIKDLIGIEQLHLWVIISDNSAQKFYEKCGFVKQGTVVKNDLIINNSYVDAIYMVKYLKH